MRSPFTFALACWLGLMAVPAAAEWSTDAEVNNLVTASAAAQSEPSIVSDGEGNYFVVWVERVEGTRTVRIQRFDSEGIATWTAGGMELLVNSSTTIHPSVFSDGAGGCVATVRTDYAFVDAQRYDSEGEPLWGESLVRVLPDYGIYGFWLVAAGEDGFLFGNAEEGSLRWISADGSAFWSEPVEFEEALNPLAAAAPDGNDGVVIAWASNGILMVQRFDSEGLAMWSEGDPVVLAEEDNSRPLVAVVGGSVFIGWRQEDSSSDQAMVLVQKFDLEGNVLWAEGGVEASVGTAGSFRMVPDASGGVWVVWTDDDDDTDALFARLLNAHGAAAWSEPAQIVSEAGAFAAVTDGLGGVVVAWTDAEATAVLAQRLTARNPAVFGSAGLVLSEPGGSDLGHNYLDLTWNGLSGFVAIWSDRRDEAGRVYLQGFSVDGKLGRPGTAPAGTSSGGGGCAATAGSSGPLATMALAFVAIALRRSWAARAADLRTRLCGKAT